MRLKELWLKLVLLFIALALGATGIFYSSSPGYFDSYYNRVATPQQNSLILGTSRAAQGLIPDILNARISHDNLIAPLFNFSFTLASTPYGESYLNLIRKKLSATDTNGLFVLSIDPWCISSTADELKTGKPREVSNTLYKLHEINCYPNFEYVFYENTRLGYLLLKRDTRIYLHEDGWLEVNVLMDNKSVHDRTKTKIAEYTTNKKKYQFSSERLQYLRQTISYLKKYGKVVLVRLPVGKDIKSIENEYMPDFKQKSLEVSIQEGVPLIDFFDAPIPLTFTDGNHLAKPSAKLVSNMLADSINVILKTRNFYDSK